MKTIILKTSLLAILISCYADCATAMQRCSSVANLHMRDDKSPKIESPEAYIELAEKFFKTNYSDSEGPFYTDYRGNNAIDNMRDELCSRIAMLYHLVNVFGVKKYTNINANSSSTSNPLPEVLAIDISWPNLKRVIQNLPEYKEVVPAKPDTTEEKPLTLAHLKWILEMSPFSKIGSEDSLKDGNSESGLSDDAVELLMKLCVGNRENRVFSIYEPPKRTEKIKGALRGMLKNMTGVQRILSVLVVSILNSSDNTPFVHALRNISISLDTCGSGFSPEFMNIKLEMSQDDDKTMSDLNHEMTHVYDHMTKGNEIEIDCHSNPISPQWLCDFSVMNSDIDFVDEFFPMFSSKNMDPENRESIVFRIKELLKTYGKYDIEFVKNIIVHLVKHGFGGIVFNDAGANLKIDKFLNPETLAKCIYVYSWIHNDSRTKADGLWNTNNEQSTILGKTVWKIGNRCFMFEDRQNEQIYNVRRKNMPGEAIGEEHRFHALAQPNRFATNIDMSLANILKGNEKDAEYKNRVEEITSYIKSRMKVLTTPSNNKFTPNSTKTQGYRNSTDISSTDILEYLLGSLENGKAKNIYPFYWTTDERTIQQLLAHVPPTSLIQLLCRAIRMDCLSAVESCLQRIPDNAIDAKSVNGIMSNFGYDAMDIIFGDNNSNIKSIKRIQEIIVNDPEFSKEAKRLERYEEKNYPFLKKVAAFQESESVGSLECSDNLDLDDE